MGNFVLVHPAWFGGWCWDKLAPQLRAHRHQVYTPTLTGLSERAHLASPDVGLLTHVEDVTAVVLFEDLRDVVLVGSSSSGSVVTAVAARIPDRVASLVYLDAYG
jgi:pimeloyl-ACP methyl ester carboxylesterase